MTPRCRLLRAPWVLVFFVLVQAFAAWAAVPAYRIVDLGAGAPIDVNANGLVAGVQGTSSAPQPWVVAGGIRMALPLPAGESFAMVTRVSEGGVVVGHANGKPLLWRPGPGGYTAQWIPLVAGATVAMPSAVIDTPAGPRVLLNYGTPGLFSSPSRLDVSSPGPHLYTETGALIDLAAAYGLMAGVSAEDMSTGGRILTAIGQILEPGGTLTPAPAPRVPGYWQGWRAWRLNNQGAMVAVASLATSDGHGELARYTPGSGWFVIETWIGGMYPFGPEGIAEDGSALTAAYLGHMLTTPDEQRLSLGSLLLDSGWALGAGVGAAMSDDGRIVLQARNPAGTWVAARLDPSGTLPPPPAVSLTGTAHPASPSEPWDAIQLRWNASTGASAYVVERKGPNDANYVALTPASGTIQTIYDDTAIAALTTYSYRVFAKGVGGLSPASNVVTVLAPPARDSTPPTASITSPANGAVVTGPITVSAQASDNVGLSGFEIRVQPNQGSEVLCSKSYATPKPSDTLSCPWDPRTLASGTVAQLTAYAYDALRNYTISPISVTYANTAADTVAPSVNVLQPAPNAVVGGTVPVSATASDNVGVVRMELRDARGALLASATGGAISYAWDTSALRVGSKQTLTVRAADAAGNWGTAKVTVRIGR